MKTTFCIVGSGIAGMSLAIRLSELGEVVLVSKSSLISGSTPLAQGGIAGVFKDESDPRKSGDSFQKHFEDTMNAGRNMNTPEAVQILVESAPKVLQDLQDWGIRFHADKHLEGGHSHHRIFHTGDTTGKTIAEGLAQKVREISEISGKIKVLEDTLLLGFSNNNDLETNCNLSLQASFYNTKTQKFLEIESQKVFLATGGYASVFENSTTTVGGIGDGISIFLQAGGTVKNLSFIQFHPTVLSLPRTPKLLLSEALRGAGAKIVNRKEEEIVAPLLPRDVVAQEIFDEEQQGERIFLDCRNVENFSEKFSSIYESLMREFFLDPTTDLLPITPAAHYCMGGIETDIYGKTNLPNVFALGECAHTGVHGKNRLASNSLLEGLVFANQIFEYIKNAENSVETNCNSSLRENKSVSLRKNTTHQNTYIPSSPESEISGKKIQKICTKFLGISRTREGIAEGKKQLAEISEKFLGTREKNMKILVKAIFDDTINVL